MTALNKQALIAKIKKQTESFDTVVLKEGEANALLDELEAAEKRYEDMLRQARSFREAHDSAAEIIRKLERSGPTVTLPTTRLWAGKVACYDEREIREILRSAGIGVKGD